MIMLVPPSRDSGTLWTAISWSTASMSNANKIGARRLQYGALPYRTSSGQRAEFMLVTSRETRRWIIPKGWPKSGKSPPRSAAHEAFEEAGVLGAIGRQSVGSFSYEKRLKNGRSVECEVRVFPLEVKRQRKEWPERQERQVKWLSASKAAKKVKDPVLSRIIQRVARKYA
jgi:8-oxo-dGTP pyrophosphatase MutT (NUDIX family)